MLTHTVRSAVTKLLVVVAGFLIIPPAHAATKSHLNLVIALDLTKSVDVQGPDGTTEFQKNVDGVTHILVKVPSGAHITIIGITDHSFAQPYILLSATIPDDPGYFGERLTSARTELVRVWKLRSAKLQPTFRSTDILGSLMLASQIFKERHPSDEQRTLVLFSDMRNSTPELNLESPHIYRSIPAPMDLYQAEVYALGVDGAGLPRAHWQTLECLWSSYLHDSGASLRVFSPLRYLPEQQMP
jgi:hypothetical protein